jgi:tRNA dimethylallyltransferase
LLVSPSIFSPFSFILPENINYETKLKIMAKNVIISLMKRKIIAIIGPTASGKTGIGVKLAKEFNGEIISADSRQVYRGLDIGTGKDLSEYDGVKYHLIDIVDPMEKMTLFDYLPLVRLAIEDILARGKTPIIVGGTGLYVQGIVEGFELSVIPAEAGIQKLSANSNQTYGSLGTTLKNTAGPEDDKYNREQLNNFTTKRLCEILQKIDQAKYEKVDHKNAHRLIRAIELAQEGLTPVKIKPDFEVLQIAIDLPRNELHERIDRRVDERFKEGMLNEVVGLINAGVSTDWLIGLGLEYRIITEYLLCCHSEGTEESSEQSERAASPRSFTYVQDDKKYKEMIQQLKFRIHQFARRQITWFKRFPEVNWLSDYAEIKRFAKIFLEH